MAPTNRSAPSQRRSKPRLRAEALQETGKPMSSRVVLITGAARGLGAVIAARFHAAGYRVALGDVAVEAATATARSLSTDESSAFALKLDVTRKEDFVSARDAIVARWDRIDALVNNAGA